MEHIIKDIVDIQYDLKQLIGRAETYKADAERGINVNHSSDFSWSKEDKLKSLFCYLEDAKNDIDRLRDDMKEMMERLTDLVDSVEYESIRLKAVSE